MNLFFSVYSIVFVIIVIIVGQNLALQMARVRKPKNMEHAFEPSLCPIIEEDLELCEAIEVINKHNKKMNSLEKALESVSILCQDFPNFWPSDALPFQFRHMIENKITIVHGSYLPATSSWKIDDETFDTKTFVEILLQCCSYIKTCLFINNESAQMLENTDAITIVYEIMSGECDDEIIFQNKLRIAKSMRFLSMREYFKLMHPEKEHLHDSLAANCIFQKVIHLDNSPVLSAKYYHIFEEVINIYST